MLGRGAKVWQRDTLVDAGTSFRRGKGLHMGVDTNDDVLHSRDLTRRLRVPPCHPMSPLLHRVWALRVLPVVALLATSGVDAQGATYTWGPGGGASGGTGNWDLTDLYWYNGSTGVVWPNTGADAAVFAGTAGTVTPTAAVQVNAMTFGTAGYTVAGGGGGSLRLTGSPATINGSARATISAILSVTEAQARA